MWPTGKIRSMRKLEYPHFIISAALSMLTRGNVLYAQNLSGKKQFPVELSFFSKALEDSFLSTQFPSPELEAFPISTAQIDYLIDFLYLNMPEGENFCK